MRMLVCSQETIDKYTEQLSPQAKANLKGYSPAVAAAAAAAAAAAKAALPP
jgi:hypothetical protein